MPAPRLRAVIASAVATLALTSCSGPADPPTESPSASGAGTAGEKAAPQPSATGTPSRRRTPSPDSRTASPSPRRTSDGSPRRALLSIPAIGLRDLPVVPYRGRTDDAPGTQIQDTGIAAAPHGPEGGTGPGGVGNYQVTAHRTSSTRAFADLPALRPGARVVVRAGGVRYVYEVRRTRQTSFRSAASLAAQRAAVPGRPGARPEKAFITLSTCATPEDRAVGNYWSDEFGNPEHRIDKIGELVAVTTL